MNNRIKYHFSSDGYESDIENNGEKYISLGKPNAGNTARCRFFGSPQKTAFLVKQPKPFRNFYDIKELKNPELISQFKKQYEHEQHIWNLVYPDKKADLITEGGLRLLIPYLPGETLSEVLYEIPYFSAQLEDQLTYCQIVLAVLREFKRFHELGLSHNDFNEDNILIEKNQNGTYQAHIIDLDDVSLRNDFISHSELTCLNGLVERIPEFKKYHDHGHKEYIAVKTINTDVKIPAEVDVILDKIKNDLPLNKPTLIKIKNTIPNEVDYYFVYGCQNDGQWHFNRVNDSVLQSDDLWEHYGSLPGELADKICTSIKLQKFHIAYDLDVDINCLKLKINDLNNELNEKLNRSRLTPF